MMNYHTIIVLLAALTVPKPANAQSEAGGTTCRKFEDIYADGKQLCETIFGDAFVYSTDYDNAYTMWFFGDNLNDNITVNRNQTVPDQCLVDYFHKVTPGPEPDNFTECHPWKEHACCHQHVVQTVDTINENYGEEFHWDRCGPLTQACERFFVQEACFYECDVNVGLFRRYPPSTFNASDPNQNTWEIYKMPIRADYCDAWFDACRHDFFCGDGDFFSCARKYEAPQESQGSDSDVGMIIGICLACVAAVALAIFVGILIARERKGEALFSPLVEG